MDIYLFMLCGLFLVIAREIWKVGGWLRGPGIPAPSGQYAVGCVDLMHQVREEDENDIFVRLFYPMSTPAEGVSTEQYAPWNPHKNYIRGYLHFLKSTALGFKTFAASILWTPRTPALLAAPLFRSSVQSSTNVPTDEAPGDSGQAFPAIIFSHGLGSMRSTYSSICIDLASHGYVVAAVEHRDLSAAITLRRVPGTDGELVDEWVELRHMLPNENWFLIRNEQLIQRASEVSRALDLLGLLNDGGDIHDKLGGNYDFSQFKGRMDLSRPAVMGHSFGGSTAVQTLSQDKRFICGIALDAWMYPIQNDLYSQGIEQPLLFINSFDFQWKENVENIIKLTKPPSETGISPQRFVTLIDSNHYSHTDIPFIIPTFMAQASGMLSKIDPVVAQQVNQEICHAFLKRHQLQDPAYQQPIPNLDGTEGHSEHILFGTNVDLRSKKIRENSWQKDTQETQEMWKTSGWLRGPGIPAPSGQYAVGCVDLMHQVREEDENDVFVRLFYPTSTLAEEVSTEQYAPWNPHKNYVRGYLHFLKSTTLRLKAFAASTFWTPRTPALLDAPLHRSSVESSQAASAGHTFPVIIFSHGVGSMRSTYSGICSDLASHGYVVAAVEHRDLSAAITLRRVPGTDGELVDEWVEHSHYDLLPREEWFPFRNKQVIQRVPEVSRALDLLGVLNDGGDIHDKLGGNYDFSQFKGRMDLTRPAVMGHSFGGATVVLALSQDKRFVCGIGLDAWMYSLQDDFYSQGIEQPLLFINSYDFQFEENVQNIMKLTKPPKETGISPHRVVTLIDSNHYNQADIPFVMPKFMVRATGMLSRIDPVVAHEVNQEISHAFLKRHQLQDPAYQQPIPNLDGIEGHSEHILFGTNVDLSNEDAQETPGQEETHNTSGQEETPGKQLRARTRSTDQRNS